MEGTTPAFIKQSMVALILQSIQKQGTALVHYFARMRQFQEISLDPSHHDGPLCRDQGINGEILPVAKYVYSNCAFQKRVGSGNYHYEMDPGRKSFYHLNSVSPYYDWWARS